MLPRLCQTAFSSISSPEPFIPSSHSLRGGSANKYNPYIVFLRQPHPSPSSCSSTCRACLMTNPAYFQVGRLIGSYGFINVTSYSGPQSQSMPGIDHSLLGAADIGEQLRMQDVGEGSVKIRLYEGRVAQGPLRGTSVVFKVYPGKRAEGVESDMMAANELNTHAFLQSVPTGISQNLSILVGGFETTTGEQWLAFRNDGKFCAVDYAKIASEKMSEDSQTLWNGLEAKEKIRHRRKFILKLLHGTMVGLAFMHKHDRLHQSLGPSSITLNTVVEKEAVYLIPRLRDLAFSVNIRYPELDDVHSTFSLQLWRRAAAAGAFSHVEKRAFGIADDIYEAGLLFAYLAFIPFCQAGIMDSLSLRRLLENTFQLDIEAAREYCLADDRLIAAIRFLDLGDGAGWDLLQAMLNPDYQKRPTAEAVINHQFFTGAIS